MGILWEDDAWQEYLDWQTQDKKTLRRITEPLPAKAGRFDLLLKQPEVVRALLYAFVL